jgi:enoyl-CoA hydratase/carnithine racemase
VPVRCESGTVTRIVLDRSERGNALSAEMLQEAFDALGRCAADPGARCIVLSGEGKHFCSGADVGDVSASAAAGARYGVGFEQLLRTIEEHPLPVIARVQGAALGAGCQLLAACDLAVAADDARIGIPSSRLGLLLDLEKIQRLVRVVGVSRTRELLLTGRAISGAEAAAWGLVTKSCPEADLGAAVEALAGEVAAGAPLSVRGSKAGIRAVLDHGGLARGKDDDEFAHHDAAAAEALASQDLQEGMRALREKRAPKFDGR